MIKDQCNNCNKQGTISCTMDIFYNSQSCELYSKKMNFQNLNIDSNVNSDTMTDKDDSFLSEKSHKIDLMKHDNYQPISMDNTFPEKSGSSEHNITVQITADYLMENTKIRGWLSFFLFSIITGGLIGVVSPIVTFNVNEYSGSYLLAMTDVVLGIMLFALACYTLCSFYKRKPNSVFLGKTYTIAIFLSSLFVLFIGEFETAGFGSLKQVIRSLVWSIIWFWYLCTSKQLKEIIPEEYRKKTSNDYFIVIGLIVVPILMFGMGVGSVVLSNTQEQTQNAFDDTLLKVNEFTDGKVIFERPAGFTCEKQELTDPVFTLFKLECDEKGSITLCSDYETDYSVKNFNGYWINWQDEEASKYESENVIDEQRIINGHPCFYKVVKYTIEDTEVFWRFIIMSDVETGKICLLSCYDEGSYSYIDEILSTIRFK